MGCTHWLVSTCQTDKIPILESHFLMHPTRVSDPFYNKLKINTISQVIEGIPKFSLHCSNLRQSQSQSQSCQLPNFTLKHWNFTLKLQLCVHRRVKSKKLEKWTWRKRRQKPSWGCYCLLRRFLSIEIKLRNYQQNLQGVPKKTVIKVQGPFRGLKGLKSKSGRK